MTILIEKEYFLWQLQRNKFDRLSLKTTLVALVMYKDSYLTYALNKLLHHVIITYIKGMLRKCSQSGNRYLNNFFR